MEEFKDENGLKNLGVLILIVGICLTLIVFGRASFVKESHSPSYEVGYTFVFNWYGFFSSLICLLSSIVIRQFLLVISNISISLKELKRAMQERQKEKE